LERAVLEVERTLNSSEAKAAHPAIGRDIKVMGVRYHNRIRLTIACAMVGRHLDGIKSYVEATDVVRKQDGELRATIEEGIRERVQAELSRFPELQSALLEGRVTLY
jgi:S-adenosylmethionine synthetase